MKQNEVDWNQYYNNVLLDFRELKEQYPFCYLTIPPTIEPSEAEIRVVAVNKGLINMVGGVESDFLGDYSKKLHLHIPVDYRHRGCIVYGADWVNIENLANDDIHFFHKDGKVIRTQHGLQICVGTPESFPLMRNVILENVKTAENMLIAYERVMTGSSKKLEMIAYAHGIQGRIEFQHNSKRYISKK